MKHCAICGKTSQMSGTRVLLRAHFNPTKSSRKQPNLQWVKIPGQNGRVRACVKCLRKTKKANKKPAK